MSEDIKPGKDTTEYAEAKSASIWGIVAMVLGMLLTVGASVAEGLGADTKIGVIVGAVVAVAGIGQKTLVSLGYIKGRSEIKAEAEK